MEVFIVEFYSNFGLCVDIIVAKNREEATKMVSSNAKGWGYLMHEVDRNKGEGIQIELG